MPVLLLSCSACPDNSPVQNSLLPSPLFPYLKNQNKGPPSLPLRFLEMRQFQAHLPRLLTNAPLGAPGRAVTAHAHFNWDRAGKCHLKGLCLMTLGPVGAAPGPSSPKKRMSPGTAQSAPLLSASPAGTTPRHHRQHPRQRNLKLLFTPQSDASPDRPMPSGLSPGGPRGSSTFHAAKLSPSRWVILSLLPHSLD